SIRVDFGAWRDIQRHRMLSHGNFPRLSFGKGYYVPTEFRSVISIERRAHPAQSLREAYLEAMREAEERWRTLRAQAGDAPWLQYLLPLACHVDTQLTGNLREWFYFAERRSGRECHPAYRVVAQQVAHLLSEQVPGLKDVWLVDYEDHEFARTK